MAGAAWSREGLDDPLRARGRSKELVMHPLPAAAKFEDQMAGGVAVYDVTHLMPQHKTKRYEKRSEPIVRRYIHHSGALGRPGLKGARVSASYLINTRGWPGCAYHFWNPFEPVLDAEGRLVLFRTQADETRSWHTGGPANGHGVGLALQGNTNLRPLSDSQIEILEAWLPWSGERYEVDIAEGLGWHSIAHLYQGKQKKECPGQYAEQWLLKYVSGTGHPALDLGDDHEVSS